MHWDWLDQLRKNSAKSKNWKVDPWAVVCGCALQQCLYVLMTARKRIRVTAQMGRGQLNADRAIFDDCWILFVRGGRKEYGFSSKMTNRDYFWVNSWTSQLWLGVRSVKIRSLTQHSLLAFNDCAQFKSVIYFWCKQLQTVTLNLCFAVIMVLNPIVCLTFFTLVTSLAQRQHFHICFTNFFIWMHYMRWEHIAHWNAKLCPLQPQGCLVANSVGYLMTSVSSRHLPLLQEWLKGVWV